MSDQQLPISFSLGLDEKTDPKAIPLGKLLVLENAVFTKPGLLEKRNGLSLFGKQVNPTEDTIVKGEALAVFEKQLLLFNGTKAYSYIEADDEWIDKGNISSVINREYQVIRNGYQQSNADGAVCSHFECYAFEDSSGGVRYSIIDSQTGNFLISNKLLTLYGSKPKVLSLVDQFIIITVQSSVIRFTRIFIDSILATPVTVSTTNLLHENQEYDACTVQAEESINGVATQDFNSIFIAYSARQDVQHVYATPKIVKITADSWLHYSTFTDPSFGPAPGHISCCPTSDMSSEIVAVSGPTALVLWQTVNFHVAKIAYYIGGLLPQDIAMPLNFDISNLSKINIVLSETQLVNQVHTKVLFEYRGTSAIYNYIRIADLAVGIAGEAVAVSDFTNIKMKRNIGLYSKGFLNDGTVYFAATHESSLQSTYFILNHNLDVVTKFNQNNGGGQRSSVLSEIMSDMTLTAATSNYFPGYDEKIVQLLPQGNGIYKFPTQKKGKIDSENNVVFSKLGLTASVLDFKNSNHFISTSLNDNLYSVGGILQNYDGNQFTEAGFNLYPEGLGVQGSASLLATQFVVITSIHGTSLIKQETNITCISGSRIAPEDIIEINAAANIRSYYIWFKVDGVGHDPGIAGGLIPLEVAINSYYSSSQVSTVISQVLNLTGDFACTPVLNILHIQNTYFGATVPPAAISAGIGNIAAGNYNYVAIWKYIDNKGRIHRSTTSVPANIVLTGQDQSVSITVPILDLTNKKNVILEVYRTENLGSLFRRVTSTIFPTFNIVSENYLYKNVTFIDTLSDADMLSNELLYTTGDVLDNMSPPACSLITLYDQRLWIAGQEDKNLLSFTKTIDPLDQDGIGGFNDALSIALTEEGGDISAIIRMDGNLIIFKERAIYFISGTGPSNANDANNYNPPQKISSDVGCDNPNSVVEMPTGIMFHTTKGIYKLDRGMNVTYIGNAVEEHNTSTISSAILAAGKNQVRFTTEDRDCLVYDYVYDQWTIFTNYTSTDADLLNGQYVVLSKNGQVRRENETFIDDGISPIKLAFETGNLNLANVQGYQRFKRLLILGEFKGGHRLRVSFAYNFSPTFTETTTFDLNTSTTDPATEGVYKDYAFGSLSPYGSSDGYVFGGAYRPYQFRVFPTLQKCTSFRIRIEDDQVGSLAINEGWSISNLNVVVGIKGTAARIPADRSQGTS